MDMLHRFNLLYFKKITTIKNKQYGKKLISLIIIFLLTGVISGFIAGLLGVGGGIIIVPTSYFILLYLDYSPVYAMHVAIASSLGIICFTSISSIRSHLKLGNVNRSILKRWVLWNCNWLHIGILLRKYYF